MILALTLLVVACVSSETLERRSDECYEDADDPKQKNYRGTLSKTKGGYDCQKWSHQSPHKHDRTPANYPDAGLGDHNYCRNPDNEPLAWCYTTSSGKRSDECHIPFCDDIREPYDMGEKKGVQISMEGEGKTLYLTTLERIGSANCGDSCNFVFTYDSQDGGTLWNIFPYQYGDVKCYAIQKANGYMSDELLRGNIKMWSYPAGDWAYEGVGTESGGSKGSEQCWELVPTGGKDKYKLVKRKGGHAGRTLSAPTVNFKSPAVEKTRRFVILDDTNVNDVWRISAPDNFEL